MDSKTPNVPLFANLNDTDPAVAEAVTEARRTLPHFLEAASEKRFSPAIYLVKVPFIDRSKTGEPALIRTSETAAQNPNRSICHLWLRVTSVLEDLIFCAVFEAPESLRLERDVGYLVHSELIEDWMINYNGAAFGGFSLRVFRSRLDQERQTKFDSYTGISEFKTFP